MPPATARAAASRLKENDRVKGKARGNDKDKEKDKDKKWKYTKVMNMRDLSRDDDFLSHLLVEKIGTGAVPLVVHKMDPTRRLPKTEASELMEIVRRLVACKPNTTAVQAAVRLAVDQLLALNAVSYYLKGCTDKQISAFATHASRYFELYTPTGSIEIAHTSRYSHRTGKSELCILATRPLAPGKIIAELKGSMAHLTEAEDKELKRTDGKYADGAGIRRDFSVIHSKQLKKNHLFLGPARFVNHDCDHNVELFRTGRYITFRVIKPIAVGEELTAHYGDGYFGRKNRHCLCESCERLGRGGYGVDASEDDASDSADEGSAGMRSDSSEAPSDSSDDDDDSDAEEVAVNLNERRTRRGVYAVVNSPRGKKKDADAEREPDAASDLTSLSSSHDSAPLAAKGNGLMTPDPEPAALGDWAQSSESPSAASRKTTPFKSVISTRAQKAKAATTPAESVSAPPTARSKMKERAQSARQLVTPPLTSDATSASAAPSIRSVRSSSRLRSRPGAPSEAGPSRLTTPAKDKASVRASSISTEARREAPEPETRTLRPRASVQTLAEAAATARRPNEAPRGVDGKPLPTCVTCLCVLPVIQIESQVVWGLSLGRTGKRGRPRKNLNIECPRCMRHTEIYGLKWPDRVSTDGSSSYVSSREFGTSTPVDSYSRGRVTHASLATVDRKLANPVSKYGPFKRPYKRRRPVEEEEEEVVRAPKRQKQSTGRPRGRPPKKTRIGMSTKAREMLKLEAEQDPPTPPSSGRRSGRARMPSMKLRESVPPHKTPTKSSRPPVSTASSSLSSADSSGGIVSSISQFARPETPSPSGEELPKMQTPKSLAVAAQPREANGRFGKKASTNGRFMRKKLFSATRRSFSRAQRALNRNKLRAAVLKHGHKNGGDRNVLGSMDLADGRAAGLKRGSSGDSEDQELLGHHATKRLRADEEIDDDDDDDDEEEEEEEGTYKFRMPHMGGGRMGGSALLRAPNPITYARRTWAATTRESSKDSETPTDSMQSSTDEDVDLPVTPEDGSEAPIDVDSLDLGRLAGVRGEDEPDAEDAGGIVARRVPLAPSMSAHLGQMTFKPSPMNLARRRWAPAPPKYHDTLEDATSSRHSQERGITPFEPLDDNILDTARGSARFGETRSRLNKKATPRDVLEADVSSSGEDSSFPKFTISRRSALASPQTATLTELTDDERIVERLVTGTEASDSRPVSSGSSPEKSPGMAWKDTVLIKTDIHITKTTFSLTTKVPTSPTKLVNAGWDTYASSDTD